MKEITLRNKLPTSWDSLQFFEWNIKRGISRKEFFYSSNSRHTSSPILVRRYCILSWVLKKELLKFLHFLCPEYRGLFHLVETKACIELFPLLVWSHLLLMWRLSSPWHVFDSTIRYHAKPAKTKIFRENNFVRLLSSVNHFHAKKLLILNFIHFLHIVTYFVICQICANTV